MPQPPAGLSVEAYIAPPDPLPARPEVVALIRQAAGALAIDRAGSPEGDPE